MGADDKSVTPIDGSFIAFFDWIANNAKNQVVRAPRGAMQQSAAPPRPGEM